MGRLLGPRKFGHKEARRTLDALREGSVTPTRELGVIVGAVVVGLGIPNTAVVEATEIARERREATECFRARAQEVRRAAEARIARIRVRVEALVKWLNDYLKQRTSTVTSASTTRARSYTAKAVDAEAEATKADEVANLF